MTCAELCLIMQFVKKHDWLSPRRRKTHPAKTELSLLPTVFFGLLFLDARHHLSCGFQIRIEVINESTPAHFQFAFPNWKKLWVDSLLVGFGFQLPLRKIQFCRHLRKKLFLICGSNKSCSFPWSRLIVHLFTLSTVPIQSLAIETLAVLAKQH